MSTDALLHRRSRPVPTHRRSRSTAAQHRAGWLFVAPFALLLLVLIVIPLLWAVRMSLFTDTLARGEQFTGLTNFAMVLRDPEFLGSVGRILLLGAVQVPVTLGLAMFAALLLDHFTGKYPKLYRLALFLPYAVPGVVAVLMWGYLYSPTFGPLQTNVLTPSTGLAAIGNVLVWSATGFMMIIIHSALQGVPQEIYQAARVDGAGPVRLAIWIKIPMIAPSLVLTGLLAVFGAMQLFTEPDILSAQAPDVFVPAYTPNTYAHNLAFSYAQFNYAAAVSFTIGFLVFIASFILLRLTRKRSGLS
ncbi:carbohydrate ABC transporter permease [Ruania alba]|uniref:Multiple sugar transport system permease protein n=1 Tax=Ruania alba TaxID=648782 RepID=A0A1H5GT99_9MICO|nr:sugar ABC transporter permease [Ruania alba]SEE18900.1 multiple sugar transport system permease protein [Ruania alba]